jgi:hypothetical protein
LAKFHPVDVHESAALLGVGQDEVDVMATRRRRELSLVLRELTPVAGVGNIDGRDDRTGRRVEADLDLATLGAAARRGVDLDVLGVREVQVGELDSGAVIGGADGLASVLGVGDLAGLGFEAAVAKGDGGLTRERAGDASPDVGIYGFKE